MKDRFLLFGGHADSLINFRGALINALLNKGLEVHVVAPKILDTNVHKELKEIGVHVHEITMDRTGTNPLNDLKTVMQLYILMLKNDYKYFLSYTHKPVLYGNVSACLAGIPKRFALITGLGYTFNSEVRWLNFLVRNLYKIVIKGVHKIFFQNPDDKAKFFDLKIINPDESKSIVVNGSGVDLEIFEKVPLPDNIQFLMIARFLIDKGIREYFESALDLSNQYPSINFGLVGWIDENPNSISEEELTEALNKGNIKFYGRLDDVTSAIKDSSIYVLPSYNEGTPRTVLEAMAMGRPIITTDAPGCRETVIDGKNGYLIPVKNAFELTLAMKKFIINPNLISKMGEESYQIAKDKYDVNKVNDQMLKGMSIS